MSGLSGASWLSSAWKNGWFVHSIRTAIGVTSSLALARVLGMQEAYWAPITTFIVLQSTLGAAWEASKTRFIGTALGALLAGLLATCVEPGMIAFGTATFALGLICAVLHLDQSAYRLAGITLAIVMLVPRGTAPWLEAVHRFVEVSLGIAVALAFTSLWPGQELASGEKPDESPRR